jgi:hypothetical protein
MVFAVLCISPVFAPSALADDADLRLGNFGSSWCGYDARFNIESRDGDSWVFHGHIEIAKTNEYDELRIEQLDNNSLHMVRYLTGGNTGQTQIVQTRPPKTLTSSVDFIATNGHGGGCDGDYHFTMLSLPR